MMGLKLLVVFCLFSIVITKDIRYFSTIKPGVIHGKETLITDYLTIGQDPNNSSLPDEFTICSSLLIDVMTTTKNIFHIYKRDGTPWFNLGFEIVSEVQRMKDKKETLWMRYDSGKYI